MTSLSQKSINNSLTRANGQEIAGFAFPSNHYVDMSLGASGTNYPAEENGYFVFSKKGSAATQWVTLGVFVNGTQAYKVGGPLGAANGTITFMIPVKKGYELNTSYDLNSTTSMFRFVYAGESE